MIRRIEPLLIVRVMAPFSQPASTDAADPSSGRWVQVLPLACLLSLGGFVRSECCFRMATGKNCPQSRCQRLVKESI